ncbi:MAG: PAS domain S-box protein [bacterium]|nr:PAS domain S-box protein [bacterium]
MKPQLSTIAHAAWRTAVAALAYVLTAWLSMELAFLPDRSSTVWLPAGVALGLTYWWGYPIGLLGTGLGAGFIVWQAWGLADLALLSAVPVMLQAGVGAWLIRALNIHPHLPYRRDVVSFLSLCAATAVISPLLNTSLRRAYNITPSDLWSIAVLHRWMGDFLGHLVLGGLLLTWWNNWRMRRRDYAKFLILTLLGMASVSLGFHIHRIGWVPGPSLTIVLPAFVAMTFAFQQRGVSWMSLVIVLMLSAEVARWRAESFIQLPEFLVGWFFTLFNFSVFMVVASLLTQQREYAQRLNHAYQQLRAIMDNAPSLAMQILDEQGRVQSWNRASERIYGYSESEMLGKTLEGFLLTADQHREFMEMLQQVAQTHEPAPIREWRVRTADGKERYILSSLFPIHFDHHTRLVCADIDITERKLLEQRLFHAEKMESIGQLAGGIAHDFNNLLTAILGFAELAQMRLPPDHSAQADLQRIVEASERAANLVRQLLGFARKQLTQPQPTDLNRVVRDLVPLLERTLGETVRLETHLTDADCTIYIDPTQLEQVIMNLAMNARDAMLPKGGVLTLTTLRKTFTQAPPNAVAPEEQIPPGDYVCLEVRDTGAGIPPDLRERIFEPFFSTKGVGNTGLGLATVYGIVRQNSGFVTLDSEVGVGTTFCVVFPAWTRTPRT